MINLYFGKPGAGKTTLLAAFALKEQNKILSGKSRYKYIYSNIKLNIPGVIWLPRCSLVFGIYNVCDSLVLIDEATLIFDSRDFKSFSQAFKEFFLLHRHYNLDVCVFCQQYDGVDKKIRDITSNVYMIYPGRINKNISYCLRIPYDVFVPKRKDSDNPNLGKIINGYYRGGLFDRLLCVRLWRPAIYKYFDSWERYDLPPLPDELRVVAAASSLPGGIKEKMKLGLIKLNNILKGIPRRGSGGA